MMSANEEERDLRPSTREQSAAASAIARRIDRGRAGGKDAKEGERTIIRPSGICIMGPAMSRASCARRLCRERSSRFSKVVC